MGDQITRLELPAEISSLQRLTDFVRCAGKAAAFGERELGQLELVVEEILVNVARYAYPEGQPGTIELCYTVEGGNTLFVQVSDTGQPFDPLATDSPDLQLGLAERPIGGLGIFLVKQFARTIEYQRVENRNVLSFRLANFG